ncbi:hypothetical protein N2152v2_005196 [Parachlorella kessleri]
MFLGMKRVLEPAANIGSSASDTLWDDTTLSRRADMPGWRHLTDVTEIFREVKSRKKQALAKLVLYLGAFVWTIYRLVEVIIVGLITPKGRAAAKDVLRQAAAALNR